MPETANTPHEKVRQLQRKLWVCAKRSRTRRFHALYDRIYRSDVLWEAWRRVRSNGGAAGVDAETIRAIEKRGAETFLAEIQAALRAGVAIPYECATGTCGTCKARRIAGVTISDWAQAPGNSYLRSDRDEALLCQTRALSECSFEIPGSVNLASTTRVRPHFGWATVGRIEPLTADTVELLLELEPALVLVVGPDPELASRARLLKPSAAPSPKRQRAIEKRRATRSIYCAVWAGSSSPRSPVQ